MAKQKKDNTVHYLASSLFLIGLVFLVESVVLALVLSQAPAFLLGSTAPVAWMYALIKLFTGLVAMFAAISLSKKK